uniref:Uncharacterized protein n=1 Tax=Plectus sambesii TaxID=2011161 RepID=A0A914W217_9BILA
MLRLAIFNTLLIILQIESVQASSCGTGAVPFRLEVLPSGAISIGCAVPSCFGGEEGGADAHQHEDSKFNPSDETANRKDGFIRDNDAQRPRFRQETAPRQKAVCEDVASSLACTGLNEWVGGIGGSKDGNGPMKLQCCTYSGMAQSTVLGGTVIGENEALIGGEVLTNGRQTAFDVISNVQQIISPSQK